jgi:hypothetical protein
MRRLHFLHVPETSDASPPGRCRGSGRFGRTGRCASCRALEHRHVKPMSLLECLSAPESQMWTRRLSRFECDRCYHEGELKLPNRSRIRRKGVGWDLEELRAEPSMADMLARVVFLDKESVGPLQGLRWEREEIQKCGRRWNSVLILNRPGVRMDWSPVNPRSHEANHQDWLSEVLPVTGRD